jgi:hypothetical protein
VPRASAAAAVLLKLAAAKAAVERHNAIAVIGRLVVIRTRRLPLHFEVGNIVETTRIA